MNLVVSMFCLGVALILINLARLASRYAKEPAWGGDFWVGSVYVPLFMGFAIIGGILLALLLVNWQAQSVSWLQAGEAAAVMAGTGFIAFLLQRRIQFLDRRQQPIAAPGGVDHGLSLAAEQPVAPHGEGEDKLVA